MALHTEIQTTCPTLAGKTVCAWTVFLLNLLIQLVGFGLPGHERLHTHAASYMTRMCCACTHKYLCALLDRIARND